MPGPLTSQGSKTLILQNSKSSLQVKLQPGKLQVEHLDFKAVLECCEYYV